MSRMDELRQSATTLDRFLHASVGDDRNGSPVTVLSTFARLGLDPWEEAAELSRLTQERARLRLGTLLDRFRDVSASGDGWRTQRLIDLLPQTATGPARGAPGSKPIVHSLGIAPIVAAAALLLVVAQALLRNLTG